jgi:hypothetical protein
MKIVDVRSFRLAGPAPYDPETFWEERLAQPVDIYPKWRERGPNYSISARIGYTLETDGRTLN